MVPVTVGSLSGEGGKAEGLVVGRLPIDIEGGDGTEHLDLLDIVALLTLFVEVVFHFVAVETLRQEPGGVAQPEEGGAILMHEIAMVG